MQRSLVILIALVFGMVSGLAVRMPDGASEAHAPVMVEAAGGQNAPFPTPTTAPTPSAKEFPPPEVRLSPWPLLGTPPYTATFTGHLLTFPLTPSCRTVRWDFGDGSTETRPCPPAHDDTGVPLDASHIYHQAGTYYVNTNVVLHDGQVLTSTTQSVLLTLPQPVSWRDRLFGSMRYWGSYVLVGVVSLVVLVWSRRRRCAIKIAALLVLGLGLVTCVPPFSLLPNPIGAIWLLTGTYHADPRLPFANRFVIAGDPTTKLQPYLDTLIGQRGLDPLDPVQPLVRYEFVGVSLQYPFTTVDTRMIYAGGTQRTYAIPLTWAQDTFGFYQHGWLYDGLGRLRTEHRELPGTPFATAAAPVRVLTPTVLALHPAARQIVGSNLAAWGPWGVATQHLVWSPQGDAFLALQANGQEIGTLWHIPLDGSAPVRVATEVGEYAWTPDGSKILYRQPANASRVVVVTRDLTPVIDLIFDTQVWPGLTNTGLWYPHAGNLVFRPFDGSEEQVIAPLPAMPPTTQPGVLRNYRVCPSPDGIRVILMQREHAWLWNRATGQWTGLPEMPDGMLDDVVWSPDGTRLARIHAHYNTPATLTLLQPDGTLERTIPVAPNGLVGNVQWKPDGTRLFIQTLPFGGRRILTVDDRTGAVLDLSQPRWDTWFALAPDGTHLLLANGRGNVWLSELAHDQ